MRIVTTFVIAAFVATTVATTVSAQSPSQEVLLEGRSAARALDAIPAVFAVAQNLEGIEIDVSADGMASGFSDLAAEPSAQEQLTAALGAYGFEGYDAWAATIRTIFATYSFIRSEGQAAPTVARALKQVLDDAGVPQSQKDAIVIHIGRPRGKSTSPDGVTPIEENLVVVIGLMPQIESTTEMMRAMQ